MKNYVVLLIGFFITASVLAQDAKSTFVEKGDLVEATYYYDSGVVQQEGTFKNGKLHGTWTSYDVNGNKTSIGNYNEGKKTGKWFFWVEDHLKEVDYVDSKIVSVHEWKDKNELAIRNR